VLTARRPVIAVGVDEAAGPAGRVQDVFDIVGAVEHLDVEPVDDKVNVTGEYRRGIASEDAGKVRCVCVHSFKHSFKFLLDKVGLISPHSRCSLQSPRSMNSEWLTLTLMGL